MTNVYRALMWIAGCGLVLSIIAHCMAFAGLVLLGGKFIWAVHIGIFVVWLPTVVALNSMRHISQNDIWKVAFAGCPPWMRRAFYILCGYAVLSFIQFVGARTDEPRRPIDDASPSTVRGVSGHWMIFYAAAFCTLYSRVRAPHLYMERICPQGHKAAPTAKFCSECGHEFSMAKTNE
jgi:hypothetical protein